MAEKSGELTSGMGSSGVGSSGDRLYGDSPAEVRRESPIVEGKLGSNGLDDTELIKARIEETRSQLGDTIDAIQERLSIENISEQVKEQVSEQITSALDTAKESVYEATFGNLSKAGKFMKEAGRELSRSEAGQYARKNPFPLVLIALGVGLLAYDGFGGGRRRRLTAGANGDESNGRGLVDKASGAYDKVAETASESVAGIRDAAGNAVTTVTETANSAVAKVGDYAGAAYEKVGEYGVQAREQYEHYIEDNPLAVGAVALAVGAAVGLSIPATRYESQYLGDYSRKVLDRAHDAAGDLVERVKEVAGETGKTIGEEAEKQGFTS